ncbi:Retrotransposon-derived protein PEG10 [Anabarilius grahami]|uniref:Retrotransposon-derived protein PEG10 n=1 Tax=Anabarilius grahami TaxID=495550 RepID=A0A3N0XKR0_ANAGA|nr:Retrotransposon-derived protein PEG10 [Anabarilius grahami]
MSSPDPFQDLVNALCRTLTSTPTQAPPANTSAFRTTASSPSVFASPMARPAPFSGSAEDCNGFILQCSLVLEMQPHLYPDDKAKIAFIIQLNDIVRVWIPGCGCILLHTRIPSASKFIHECPTRPVRSMVSVILPTLNHQNPLTIVANLTAADVCIPVNAFIDSGSAGNFISGALCRQFNLKTVSSPKVYQIHAVTGRPLCQVRHMVGPLCLQIGVLHQEDIHLLVLEDSTSEVILGRPWLEQHDPIISWRTGDNLKWGNKCFPELQVPSHVPSQVQRTPSSMKIPVCYSHRESS